MSTSSDSSLRRRDGTSQEGRSIAALNPAYVSVDERSLRDLLELTRQYATNRLHYFDASNDRAGTWSEFLPHDLDLDQLVAWLENPERFNGDSEIRVIGARPHRALFLTFLELLRHSQTQLNQFTRRHLEFYYRDLLRLETRSAEPDHIHVLMDLVPYQESLLLRAGTTLLAGQDSAGNDLLYQTDDDLVATHMQVAELKTLYTEKRTIRLSDVRKDPLLLPTNDDTEIWRGVKASHRPFLAMVLMVLGAPETGMVFESKNKLPELATQCGVWDSVISAVRSKFSMSLTDFQELMRLTRHLDPASELGKAEWGKVNGEEGLNIAGDVAAPDDFEANLRKKVGLTKEQYVELFERIPEVSDVFDLYRQHNFLQVRRNHLEPGDSTTLGKMEALIQKELKLGVTQFRDIMKIVESFNERWRQVVDVLRTASRKKPGRLAKENPVNLRAYQPYRDRMDQLLQDMNTLQAEPKTTLEDLQAYDRQLTDLEDKFHIAADDWSYVRGVVQMSSAPSWELAQVYEILEQAHRDQLMMVEGVELHAIRTQPEQGFDSMIERALSHARPSSDRSESGSLKPQQKPFLELDIGDGLDRRYVRDQLRLDPTTCKSIQDFARRNADVTSERVWQSVYRQLVQAKWRRLGTPDPRPDIDLWDNLFAATKAELVQPKSDSTAARLRWPTFGSGSANSGTDPGTIGLAIASPLLALAEGTRTIMLTFRFDDKDEPAFEDEASLQFLLSTEKGMLPFDVPKKDIATSGHTLKVTVKLQPEDPPITPLPSEFQPAPASPVLHLSLRDYLDPKSKRLTKAFRALADLELKDVDLEVTVGARASDALEADVGLTPSALQSDEGILDPSKPFLPFGSIPTAHSRLLIGHPELVCKPIKRLSFAVDWMGIPTDGFRKNYTNYDRTIKQDSFKVTTSWRDNGVELRLNEVGLFDHLANSRSLMIVPGSDLDRHANAPASRGEGGSTTDSDDLGNWARCFQWRLNDPDFQHLRYPALAASKSLEMAAAITNLMAGIKADPNREQPPEEKQGVDAEKYKINPPYTPIISRLQIYYSASETILPGTRDSASCLYHLEPFGYRPIPLDSEAVPAVAELTTAGESKKSMSTYRLFPQFPHAGELFIGLSGMESPQNLSLLFQMADGSADPDLEREPIQWSYLDANRWLPLGERRLLEDATEGLLKTGIIRFDLPRAAPSTLLPGDLHWIRGSIARNPRSVCDAVAIHAQAVRATRILTDQSPNDLGPPLAPETIKDLEEPQPALQAVRQPYTSFGGRDAEHTERFYTRVAERLRHRNRALTSWDYERMILEAFPEVYKVKCLPVGSSNDPREADLIQVFVIPDIRGKLPSDPFQPRTPADTLRSIEQFLQEHASPLARFRIKNPRYVRLRIRAVIRFQDGCNVGFYRPRLNDELVRYLAPWAYDDGADILFGNEIDIYQIVNFLEERPYVDFVAHIDRSLFGPDGEPWRGEAATDVIYVSNDEHRIEELNVEEYESQVFSGIGYMAVGQDFVVAEPPRD